MSHLITNKDGFFTVREPAWHGLGVVLPDYPTREAAQQIAHPWEPVSEPVYRRVTRPRNWPLIAATDYEQILGQHLNSRSDTGEPLAVVADTTTTVTNGELYDIAEAIEGEDKGSVQYETGGSLKGGRMVWLLIRLREPLQVPGDPHGSTIAYYALQNHHDGEGSFRGQATMVRIVCANTSHIADVDAQARGTEFVFRHTRNVGERIEQAKKALAGWRVSIAAWHEWSTHWITVELPQGGAERFIHEFVPMPPPHLASDRVVGNVNQARELIRGILAGPTCEGINNTPYGLVQAATEYAEHYRAARSQETRFKRAYLDRSIIVADAVKIAEKVAS